jgi:hypothetical protein
MKFPKNPHKRYEHYLKWFEEQVADEANWPTLRADKDCANYMAHDEDGNPIDPGKPIPYSRGEALFKMIDPKKFEKQMKLKLAANHQKYNEMSQYINGDPIQGKLNPEYVKRFEDTKKLKEQLTIYAGGDKNAASDELFKLSKEAQDKGEVWHPYPIEQKETEVWVDKTIPKPLENKILHFLWKIGIPVSSFTKKELDVDVADQINWGKKWK